MQTAFPSHMRGFLPFHSASPCPTLSLSLCPDPATSSICATANDLKSLCLSPRLLQPRFPLATVRQSHRNSHNKRRHASSDREARHETQRRPCCPLCRCLTRCCLLFSTLLSLFYHACLMYRVSCRNEHSMENSRSSIMAREGED